MYWHDANQNGQIDEDFQCVLETNSFEDAIEKSIELFNLGEYHSAFVVDCETEKTIPVPLKQDENGNFIAGL